MSALTAGALWLLPLGLIVATAPVLALFIHWCQRGEQP